MWERYGFPHNVRVWIKVNEKGGGAYAEPNYFNEKYNDPRHACMECLL